MNRRQFLRVAGATGSGLVLGLGGVFAAETERARGPLSPALDPKTMAIPDTGWRLWRDVNAEWKQDRIFLPADVRLPELPVRPPTGGWEVLRADLGHEVTLPATVEQFYWGDTGFRPYQNEYKFEATDDEVKNGAYYGVSWWWRTLDIPAAMIGRRLRLHVRGARQRAEVFLNQKLVGYSIMEELPFECDLTAAAQAGENQLAIRITNPGGRLDWVDGSRVTWGAVEFQKSHGFGGIDRGMTLQAHGDVRIADAWVLNTPQPRTVTLHVELQNHADAPAAGTVRLLVIDPQTNQTLATREQPLMLGSRTAETRVTKVDVPQAELWDLATPRLYRFRAVWRPEGTAGEPEQRDTEFGFRWFGVDGLGKDAMLRLNGRRIRLYTSISWGFWALNGLFPTPELTEKEVRAAKAFNLNCLNFHRNLPKEDVLALQDRMGLLRCLEPGGGSQAVTPRGREPGFGERYMQAKILGMIRAFRSHPSVVHYIIQNEGRVDPTNPALDQLFAAMRAADPSRSIVASDGFVMRSPQAWEQAYSDTVLRSEKPATLEGGAGGWWVDHSGHASDVWQDGCYVSPQDYYYRSPNRAEIVEWGEMKGPASSDDHVEVLAEIKRHGGTSYDRLDHAQILAACDAFLDRWGFRTAFPSASVLFQSIGRRAYESWGQFMENVRINDETDMAAISGWESTAMENHSGLVDNFRNFKADPRPIAESLLPLRPLAKQRRMVFAPGERGVFDLYLLNDTGAAVAGELVFSLVDPTGRVVQQQKFPVPAFERDRLSYLVHEAFTTEPMATEGSWRSRFELSGKPEVTHERELLVIGLPAADAKPLRVALANVSSSLAEQLTALPGVSASPFAAGGQYDVVVFGGVSEATRSGPAAVDADGAEVARAKAKQTGLPEPVLEAVRAGLPLLALPGTDAQAAALGKQLADSGAFRFNGMVGGSRASWMGAWYFVRQHPLYSGLPVNEAMGTHYQVRSGGGDGWRVDGDGVDVVVGYARDHDRNLGAGTLTAKVGRGPVVLHYIPSMHVVAQRRFLLNAVRWLGARNPKPETLKS